jgi:hypothetical protein
LLASSALREIDEPANDAREVHLINLVRLLDMYRHGKLTGRTPHGVLQSKPIGKSKFPRMDRGVADVERALDVARLSVRPAIDKDVFVTEFRNILLDMAEKETPAITPETVELVKAFVAKLAEELVRA